VGSILSFLAAEGENGEFKRIYRDTFRGEDVEQIRIGGYTGGPEAALDVRVIDVRIRTKAKLELQGAGVAPPGNVGWLTAGGIIGLAAGFSLLGLWWCARQRRLGDRALAAH
jgi:hypothetical protein